MDSICHLPQAPPNPALSCIPQVYDVLILGPLSNKTIRSVILENLN